MYIFAKVSGNFGVLHYCLPVESRSKTNKHEVVLFSKSGLREKGREREREKAAFDNFDGNFDPEKKVKVKKRKESFLTFQEGNVIDK